MENLHGVALFTSVGAALLTARTLRLARESLVQDEAVRDKARAKAKAPQLVAAWQEGPPSGTARLFYWRHFWGRAEIWRMVLHFSRVPCEFMGFTNHEVG